MRELIGLEIAQVSGAGVDETLDRAAIHQGQLSKSRP